MGPLDAGYLTPSAPVIRTSPVIISQPAPILSHHIPHFAHHAPIVAPVAPPLPVRLIHAAPQPIPAPILQSSLAPAHFTFPASLDSAPLPVAAPAPLPVPLVAPSSQFHAQDEFGQQSINQARTESRDAFGVTHGSYQYVDANGLL